MSQLINHLESYVGRVMHGWAGLPGLEGTGVQIAQHDSTAHGANLVLSTLSLSRYGLRSASSGETIYHELLFFANDPATPRNLPGVLAQLVALTLSQRRPLLKGDIIGPGGPILHGSQMEAVFATLPVLLPPEFASTVDDEGHGIALVWLLPITREEALWAKRHGWEAFETELDRQVPDGLNWHRKEMALT